MRKLRSQGFVLTCTAALAVALWLAACSPAAPAPETPLPLAWQARVTNVISRPTVSDGLIFVVDEFSNLIALDAETGTKRWEVDLTLAGHSDDPVGADGGSVFAAVHGDVGKVLAFDAKMGAQQWEMTFGPYHGDEHPIAHEGLVYFEATGLNGTTASLHAADAATGAAVWEFPIGSNIATSPILGRSLVYVGAYHFDGPSTKTRRVFAIDTATGQARWTYPSDLDLSGHFALDDARLYIGADGGVVIARDAATGGPAWTARVGGRLSSSPTVAGGLVYVGIKEGQMIALNAEDGAQRWGLDVGSPILTQAAVTDGVVYFGTNDGYLHAVDSLTGAEQWKVQSPLRKPLAVPDYVPAMGTTPVVTDDLLLYFDGNTLNALKLR
ncbi:MAG: PQQ-binding-like beta-propeller repeat protein [Chloroflexi bacterium]|nr:PQQ-binding-like beta-propeller repeat protein [Chloroflexota bacterium]